jgi:hypothetical protein
MASAVFPVSNPAQYIMAAFTSDEPKAKFIVYLCTNRRLGHDLMHEVYLKSDEFGIEVCFLEQSQLSDFLDTKPEGQWLRQQYLGIDGPTARS